MNKFVNIVGFGGQLFRGIEIRPKTCAKMLLRAVGCSNGFVLTRGLNGKRETFDPEQLMSDITVDGDEFIAREET